MFHTDPIIESLVERKCAELGPKCPYLVRLELECFALGQLQAEGKAMRYLRRNCKTVAWKATPKLRKEAADKEADCKGAIEA